MSRCDCRSRLRPAICRSGDRAPSYREGADEQIGDRAPSYRKAADEHVSL